MTYLTHGIEDTSMPDRRTHAWIAFIGQLFRLSHLFNNRRSIQAERPSVHIEWFVAGIIYAIGGSWARDRDLGGIRTDWKRRGLLAVVLATVGITIGSQTSKPTFNDFALGDSIGKLCYRLWYGVLHPLPGTDQ